MVVPTVIAAPNPPGRRLYFDNNAVEDLLVRYHWTGCTNIDLRDQIMIHAEPLIRMVIATHKLQYIGVGDRTVDSLVTEAWLQIERVLYKFRGRPHCGGCFKFNQLEKSALHALDEYEYKILTPKQVASLKLTCPKCKTLPTTLIYRGTTKVFNMWSSVARTVILALIKKESRDAINREKCTRRTMDLGKPQDGVFYQFIQEAEYVFRHDVSGLRIVAALKELAAGDEQADHGLIGKLSRATGLNRGKIVSFLSMVRLRQDDFVAPEDCRLFPVMGGVEPAEE